MGFTSVINIHKQMRLIKYFNIFRKRSLKNTSSIFPFVYLLMISIPVFEYLVDASTEETKSIKLAVAVIENRFIAKGTIIDIKRASKGIQGFTMQIKKTEQFENYPNFGKNYLGKTVEVFSETGIPSSFQAGVEVSLLLRVSGDERGQHLFLVEVIKNGSKK